MGKGKTEMVGGIVVSFRKCSFPILPHILHPSLPLYRGRVKEEKEDHIDDIRGYSN